MRRRCRKAVSGPQIPPAGSPRSLELAHPVGVPPVEPRRRIATPPRLLPRNTDPPPHDPRPNLPPPRLATGATARIPRFVSNSTVIFWSSVEGRRLARWFPRGQFKVHPAKRHDSGAYGSREIACTRFVHDGIAQDQSRFFLHGPPVAGSPHTQPGFHLVVEIADSDARQRSAPQNCRGANLRSDCDAIKWDIIDIKFAWRRGRDSNPRWAINPYTLSRRAPSAARTPLRGVDGGGVPATPRHPNPLRPLLPSGPDGVDNGSSRGDRYGHHRLGNFGWRC